METIYFKIYFLVMTKCLVSICVCVLFTFSNLLKHLNFSVVYGNVKRLLEKCESSGVLNISDLALRAAKFQPVIRAVQCQSCLRELQLSGR